MLPDKLGIGTKIKCLKPNNTNSLIKKTEPRMCFSNIFRSYRSRHLQMFLWKGVLKICSKCVGEHTCRSANTWRAASEVKKFPKLFDKQILWKYIDFTVSALATRHLLYTFWIFYEDFDVVLLWLSLLHNFIQTNSEFRFWAWSNWRFKTWGSLTTVPAGNKAKRLSLVNHTTKAVHHHHHQSFLLYFYIV